MKRFVTGAWQALRRRFTMTSRPSWTILWLPSDTDDVPGDDDDQVHKAVDFYNAGTTVLHVHLHGADGKGSKRMFVFNEMLDRLRTAVPKTVLQTEVLKLSHLVRHS